MKKYILLVITALLILSCKVKNDKNIDNQNSQYFYVGTYTNDQSKGIYQYKIDINGKLSKIGLVAPTENPSFLCYNDDREYLLAVNENENGSIESYKIMKDTLKRINQKPSGGAHPCFITTNKSNYVLTANYTGGNIALHKLDEDGSISDLLYVEQHEGKGIHSRQDAPHAHSAWFFSENENHFVSVDLGTNELWFSKINDSQDTIELISKLGMENGAGPRHLALHPNKRWIYVVNELNSTVTKVDFAGGKYKLTQTISTLPDDYNGQNSCAHILVSKDGQYLYASNRGHNSIVCYRINKQNGNSKIVGFESTRGETPRNFTSSPDENFLLVANQNSNNIVSFSRDPNTGQLTYIDEITAPSPVFLLF